MKATEFSESIDVGLGPRLLAIETAIREVIDHASLSDPMLRRRTKKAVDAYLSTIPSKSEFERKFIERARACTEAIARPPAT